MDKQVVIIDIDTGKYLNVRWYDGNVWTRDLLDAWKFNDEQDFIDQFLKQDSDSDQWLIDQIKQTQAIEIKTVIIWD